LLNDENKVTVSVGISLAPEDANEFEELYNKAEKALQYVKQSGKQGYHFYKENEEHLKEEMHTVNDLPSIHILWKTEIKNIQNGLYTNNEMFTKIKQFVARSIFETRQKAQILLFTLECKTDECENRTKVADELSNLEDCIVSAVRKSDVIERFNDKQIIAVLLDSSIANAQMIVNRIKDTFFNYSSKSVSVECDIQEVADE
jgi:hypothetical protein